MDIKDFKKRRNIAILGSTGSIGTQALDVVRGMGLHVTALCANRSIELLEKQAREFKPEVVAVMDESAAAELKIKLADTSVKVLQGMDGFIQAATLDSNDVVLNSVVGMVGLVPTLAVIEAGKDLALANKETLVAGGQLVMNAAREKGVPILPVDSEHSAIFQSIVGEGDNEIEKILLTCSGGPFRKFSAEQLAKVTAADALRHPTWDMGAKITIDSATLMNKGFEVMEAKWLFGVPADKIQVLIHPQSIVHSAVQFIDGSVKAQLGVPDMRLPIQYAFSFPERLHLNGDRLDLFKHPLEFFEPDMKKFRCLALAFEAISKGGNMPCIVNAANEVVNEAFRHDRCSFVQMADVIAETMQRTTFNNNPTLDTYFNTDAEARRIANELIN